jgi:hypothetical protein
MAESEPGSFLEWLNECMKEGLAGSVIPDREKLKQELANEDDPEKLARVL